MLVQAQAKYIHQSPRKVRLVATALRGLDLSEAFNKLAIMNKRAVRPILKVLRSALANAQHNYELKEDNLYIKEIRIDACATLYRWMPKAHGRATPLRRRTSQIAVVLGERVPTVAKKAVAKKGQAIETVEVGQLKGRAKIESTVEGKKARKPETGAEESQDHPDFVGRRGRGGEHRVVEGRKKSGVFKKMFRRKAGM